MVSMLVVVLVAMVACAPLASADVRAPPPYSKSLKEGAMVYKSLRGHFNWTKEPDQEQKYFTVLISAIGSLATVLTHKLPDPVDYDVIYKPVKNFAVQMSQIDPNYFRKQIVKRLDAAAGKTQPVQFLIKTICSGNIHDPECDRIIDAIINKDDNYKDSAKILLEVGKFAELYQPREKELETAAKNNKEEEYLENGKALLKPLSYQVAKLMQKVDSMKYY